MTAATLPLPQDSISLLHLSVEKSSLQKALAHCQGVVERRNTVPILSHVLLRADQNGLKVAATDLELSLTETIPAQIYTEGETTVPAHLLFDIVRKLPEGAAIELQMDESGHSLKLHSAKSSYNFSCLPAADFPAMTEETLPCSFAMPSAQLINLIDRTRFSMSTEETRYYLNGIFFHQTADGFLRAVTTDGLRLAQAQTSLPEGAVNMPQVIVSRKTIQEIRKLADESEEDLAISLSEQQIRFEVGSSVLVSRLIEGKFPDYEKVIPYGNSQLLEVDVKAFADAVDRVSLMSTDKLRPIKLRVDNQTMSISAHSTEMGSANEELEVNYTGTSISFGFNARFILDVAAQIANPILQFLIGESNQAIILRDAADMSALYVLMPMRV